MDHQEMVDLARDHARQKPFLNFASLFSPQRVVGYEKIRVGSESDGGYVMLDDFEGINLALSFGVDINADWDLDVAARGVKIQQYDHSVPFAPAEHPNISFFQQMITATGKEDGAASIRSILSGARVTQEASTILKIDIESAEWEVFESCSVDDLAKFSQILVELHDIDRASDHYWLLRATKAISKIRSKFGVYHVHANNWSPMAVIGNVYFPSTLEVSFGNLSRYTFEPTDELFPTPLDTPNNPLRPDIYLGSFQFRPL